MMLADNSIGALCVGAIVAGASTSAICAETPKSAEMPANVAKAEDPLAKYLVDLTGGVVSASNLAGVDQSLMQKLETAQDIVVALKPMNSGTNKAGFGVAITPARTTITPMSMATYESSKLMRFLASATLSAAQGESEIGGKTYRRQAFALDTVYYFNDDQDPIYAAYKAAGICFKRDFDTWKEDERRKMFDQGKTAEEINAFLAAARPAYDKDLYGCIDEIRGKANKWNNGRIGASVGRGHIKQPGGEELSLGTMWTINATFPVQEWGALMMTARRARNGVDLQTLATTPQFVSSALYAVRLEMGRGLDIDAAQSGRYLIEVSNAGKSSAGAFKNMFKYAVGIDWRLKKGAWLEMRLGRNRSVATGQDETTGTMTFNISSVPTLFAN